MSKLEYCHELRFSRKELVAIYLAIQNQVDYLQEFFEGWYPLCEAEMQSYKYKADQLKILLSLKKDIFHELYGDKS